MDVARATVPGWSLHPLVISRKSSTSSVRLPFSILKMYMHCPPLRQGRVGGKSWSPSMKTTLLPTSSWCLELHPMHCAITLRKVAVIVRSWKSKCQNGRKKGLCVKP